MCVSARWTVMVQDKACIVHLVNSMSPGHDTTALFGCWCELDSSFPMLKAAYCCLNLLLVSCTEHSLKSSSPACVLASVTQGWGRYSGRVRMSKASTCQHLSA